MLHALSQGRPVLVIALALSQAVAWSPAVRTQEPTARDIVQQSENRAESASQRYEGVLQTTDASGKTSEKRWTFERIGVNGQGKTVIRFTSPAEVKGVALLIVNHPDRSSDQWMWTPAIERERRIAMQDRSTRFFGTDFSFEDLEERDIDQFDHVLAGEEVIDGAPCWKIESTPRRGKSSQYTRMIVWYRQADYVAARIDSYVKDQVARRLVGTDIRPIQGIATAHVLTMTDLKRNSRTRLTLEHVQYNLPLKDDNFTLQAIRR
jgi:hypothetical protein